MLLNQRNAKESNHVLHKTFLDQTAKDYDIPLENVMSILDSCSESEYSDEFYAKLEEAINDN